jgi:hypothetical protein
MHGPIGRTVTRRTRPAHGRFPAKADGVVRRQVLAGRKNGMHVTGPQGTMAMGMNRSEVVLPL